MRRRTFEASWQEAERLARATAHRMRPRGVYPDAEDVLSEAYIAALHAMRSYRPEKGACFQTWVITRCRMQIQTCYREADHLTRNMRNRHGPDPDEPRWKFPLSLDVLNEENEVNDREDQLPWQDPTESWMLHAAIQQAARGLDDRDRRILHLWLVEEHSAAEIGRRLGFCAAAIKNRIRALREYLALRLDLIAVGNETAHAEL
jgi:RNA polymerase sigma factor (sigma-70 family)